MVIFAHTISVESASSPTQAGKMKNNTSLYHAPARSKEEVPLPFFLGFTTTNLSPYHLLQRHSYLFF
jgi:hypothetical protein